MDIIESAPEEQTNNDNLTYVDGAHKNNRCGNLVTIYELFLPECLCKQSSCV